MTDTLLRADAIDEPLLEHLTKAGTVFHTFPPRASGGVALGVEWEGWRYFVKFAPKGKTSGLERARVLRRQVHHSALPRILNSFTTEDGQAQVYEWVDGDNVYDHSERFYSLPVRERLRCLTVVYDAHQMIADAGFIAVDFYDGCLIYDFERRVLNLCDLDEYRPDPFRVTAEQLPGSTRFMAPEELETGALIDHVTNVYTLGRAALVLLGDGTGSIEAWGWSEEALAVASRASDPDRRHRFESVKEYVDAWLQAIGPI